MEPHQNPIHIRAPSHTHVRLYKAQNKVMVAGRVMESTWENSGNVKYKEHSGKGARGQPNLRKRETQIKTEAKGSGLK